MSEVIKNSVCYMCMLSCPMKLHITDGKVTKVERAIPTPVPCVRWQAQIDFVYHPDRLQYPLKRTGKRHSGTFERVSWDEALDTVATNLQKVKDTCGPEAVAFWVSYTKEPRPYFHRLTHAFGSPNYCTESSSCASSASLANIITYGVPFLLSGRSDPECMLIWSSTILNNNPRMWSFYTRAKDNGAKFIVVDPRLTKLASMADIHLQLRPGTDGALALAMINVIIKEKLHDKEFIEKWTVGFDDLQKVVNQYTPEYAERITWIPAEKIREAAILYATNKPSRLVTSANSTTHHTNGFQNHRAIILLPAITGAVEAPLQPPTEMHLNDITMHERVKNMPPGVGSQRFPVWTSMYGEMQSNALADQIDSSKPYPIKAVFSAGLDIQFFPNSKRMVESLKKLDFIAVTEFVQTPGTQIADVILPIASWWERPILMGTMHGHGDRVILVEPAIDPVGESWSEWKIYSELAKRLGFGDEFWGGDFKECVNYILKPSGLTYADLQQHPEGIPVSNISDKPSKSERFMTPSGKIEITSSLLKDNNQEPLPLYKEPVESPISSPDLAKEYPLVLTTGARVPAYTHSQFRNINRLRKTMQDPLAEINPVDAGSRGITSGDDVIISSTRGSIKMKANVTDTILAGVVSIPHHWPGEANANILTDDENLDPISGFPPFKSLLCQVKKVLQ